MAPSTDSDSSDDSDKGIRYKTDSIRNKRTKDSSRKHHKRKRHSTTHSDEEYERHKRNKEKRCRREKEMRNIKANSKCEGFSVVKTVGKIEQNTEKHEVTDPNFGPALPPHLMDKCPNTSSKNTNNINDNSTVGPLLPPHVMPNTSEEPIETSIPEVIGPVLPPHLQKSEVSQSVKQEDLTMIGTGTAESTEKDDPAVIGPALPPYLQKSEESAKKDDPEDIEPVLLPHLQETEVSQSVRVDLATIGPALPPHLQKPEVSQSIKKDNPAVVGPALPPHLQNPKESIEKDDPGDIGPALPAHLLVNTFNDEEEKEEAPPENVIGPTLPQHLRKQLAEASPCVVQPESDEDDCYGPLPMGAPLTKSHLELEERSLQLKIDQLNPEGNDEPKREEWMIELPAVKAANLGLGPRTFRMKGGPDMSNRSSWTETPKDKAKKEVENDTPIDLKKDAEMKYIRNRDKEQEEQVKKSKRTSDSLLDIHVKKMKEKKKDETSVKERRPFSRDVDLQVNKFDEAQKKAVLKKAQLLDDRFSSGQSKFL